MQTSRFYKMRWKVYYSGLQRNAPGENLPLASSARAQDMSVGKIGQWT